MTAITVRLTDEDHALLRLYCAVTGKSQNAILTELLRGELDRVLPGKREALRTAAPGGLWEALGVAQPVPGVEAEQWSAQVLDSLHEGDAGRAAA